MTLPSKNKFYISLQSLYGKEWRSLATEDTGYTYGHLWRMITGKSAVPIILQKYITLKQAVKKGKIKSGQCP